MMQHTSLHNIKIVSFDLDETLHNFKESMHIAIDKTLEYLAGYVDVNAKELAVRYREILRTAQNKNFVENKTSFEYRKDRFKALLKGLKLKENIVEENLLNEAVGLYNTTILSNLRIKEGAYTALSVIKAAGKKVVVTTEGPQDAQEAVLKLLELDKIVDVLFTSALYETSKSEDLYTVVANKMGCEPNEILHIGDNYQRDYIDALNKGMQALLLDQDEKYDDVPSIRCLTDIQKIFEEAPSTTSQQDLCL